jgi:hypothetical protein
MTRRVAVANLDSLGTLSVPSNSVGRRLLFKVFISLIAIALVVILFEVIFNRDFIGSDDAYIHLRYINNLRSGHGFGFNPNHPSNGNTSPFWVILSSIITRGVPFALLPVTVKALSIGLFVASIPVFYLLAQSLGLGHRLSIGATSVYAFDPWLLKWAGSAMESSLAALFVILTSLLWIRAKSIRGVLAASICAGLTTLARPEAMALFVLCLFAHIANELSLRQKFHQAMIAIGAYLVVLSPWLIFAKLAFGTPIPNTFAAKTVASTTLVKEVAWYFLRVTTISYWPWIIVGSALLIWKSSQILRNRSYHPSSISAKTLMLWIWCFALPTFYALSKLQTPSTRYLQLTTPILIALGFSGLAQLATIPFAKRGLGRLPVFYSLTIFGLVLYAFTLNLAVVIPSSRDFSAGVLLQYKKVGEWLRDNSLPESRVAIGIDVGAIGYYSGREIVDLGGLNTREVIEYLPNGMAYVCVTKPEYLVITGETVQYGRHHHGACGAPAEPVLSLPLDLGLRSTVSSATGGAGSLATFVTVYRLSWP